MNSILPNSSATGSTVTTVSTNVANGFELTLDPTQEDLPDARDLFEVRLRGTRTLILIPKNSLAQSLLWEMLNDSTLQYSVSGQGFKEDSTLRITRATIQFKKTPAREALKPVERNGKIRPARKRKAR